MREHWGAYAALWASIALILAHMAGYVHAAEMRECLEAGPYTIQKSDPLWFDNPLTLKIEDEPEADVDQCWNPTEIPDAKYKTTRGGGLPRGSATTHEPVAHGT